MLNGMGSQLSHRKQLYSVPLSKLRLLMISRMAKPEEVLIVEDENGNIVRETMKDNDVLVQYKVCPRFRFWLLIYSALLVLSNLLCSGSQNQTFKIGLCQHHVFCRYC